MKLIVTTLLATALSTGAAAAAESSYFVGGTLGFNIDGSSELSASAPSVGSASTDVDQATGIFASGQAGLQLNDMFSVDGELLYVVDDLDSGDVQAIFGSRADAGTKSWGLMLNAQAKFLPQADLHPYVGAGVGYGQTRVRIRMPTGGPSDLVLKDDDAGVMWQLKAGITAPVSDNVSLDVGYRYLSLPDYEASESGATVKLETEMHLITFGMRYGF